MRREFDTMQITRRLYYQDSYQLEFEADVIERRIIEGNPALVLDQTCFYPESGGQPDDRGAIEGIKVIKVLEDEEKIIHVLEVDVSSDRVKGKIDWQRRFDHMQQHSGQHILSQSFYELLKAETLSFHLGESVSSVEIDLRKPEEEEVERVERRANEIIFEDREIKSYFVPEEKILTIPLRKTPQKKGEIRVVEVSGFDYSACGGTHVRRAGEIGLIKILGWERIRNNVRFEFVCGRRAREDYAQKTRIIRQLSSRFTVPENEILASVEKIFLDLKSQRKRIKKLEGEAVRYEALEIVRQAKGKIIRKIFRDKTAEQVKFLALSIIRQGSFVVLFGLKEEGRGHLVFSRSENINIDLRQLLPLVSPLIKGKGGGQPSLVEIAAEPAEDLETALEKAEEFIRKKSG
jgi:alanyl-tRNA synthetase